MIFPVNVSPLSCLSVKHLVQYWEIYISWGQIALTFLNNHISIKFILEKQEVLSS